MLRYGLASAALIPEALAVKQPASTLPPAGYAEQKTELWHMLELATNYIREISIAARRKESKKKSGRPRVWGRVVELGLDALRAVPGKCPQVGWWRWNLQFTNESRHVSHLRGSP